MDNPTEYVIQMIAAYFCKTSSTLNLSSLIKINSSKLAQNGDISFPLNSDIWKNCLKKKLNHEGDNIFNFNLDSIESSLHNLLEYGQNWMFPLAEIKVMQNRCALFLTRKKVVESLLHDVLVAKNFNVKKKDPKKIFRLINCQSTESVDLSEYRAALVRRTLQNLAKLSDWTESEEFNDENVITVGVKSVVAKKRNIDEEPVVVIKCGAVLDPQDGKLAKLSSDEYIRVRSADMRLMAMHKYGIRVKDDTRFCEVFLNLGKAAVIVDILEVKVSSPAYMITTGQGSTKGASFILYNSARIGTLLRCFDERVSSGIYEKLPPLSEIDVGLLCCEEEWELIYGYIFSFPNLISRCFANIKSGSCGIHYLIKYLEGFVSTFSTYYRRVRILTETRAHLMPHVYARIYLLKAIQEIFTITLTLLDIEPVQFM